MAFHTRSNSFPSRPHPIFQEVEEHLCSLRSSEATSTLLQLPLTQQALAQEQNEKWANEILDGSLRLLDVCSSAKDVILQTKDCTQNLQSIIRRRRAGETAAVTSEVRKYLTPRKMVKKTINKAVGCLKAIANKFAFSSVNKDHEKLREVEAVTLAVFESLLSSISGPKAKTSSWSLVSKIMQ
ncbi:unnamed protein product [Prunus armeniaca]